MRLGLLAFFSLAVPVTAGDFSLSSPVDCDLTGPCYIQQYVDHDRTENASDFTCSNLSYDGHKGTDFALPTYDMIASGVDVVAAAAGVIGGTRDGMPDIRFDASADVDERECGNGMVIHHQDGWETQYCHLRQGSVSVSRGDRVQAGDVIGQVGMSGRAEFPHLHLSVRRNGEVIDPFDPDGTITCGETDPETLWSEVPPYRAGGIISIGAAPAVPEFSQIRANSVPSPDATSDALVIYAFLFGNRQSDIIHLALDGPDGMVISRGVLLMRPQAQSFRAIGKKLSDNTWPSGTYTGSAELRRAGEVVERQEFTFSLP
jgi:hypothetical protein